MEIKFKEFKPEQDDHKYQITGTVNGMSISDHYNRDSKLWRFNRWLAERRILNGFATNYKSELNEAFKNYRCK
jgi:hypothetical protein